MTKTKNIQHFIYIYIHLPNRRQCNVTIDLNDLPQIDDKHNTPVIVKNILNIVTEKTSNNVVIELKCKVIRNTVVSRQSDERNQQKEIINTHTDTNQQKKHTQRLNEMQSERPMREK